MPIEHLTGMRSSDVGVTLFERSERVCHACVRFCSVFVCAWYALDGFYGNASDDLENKSEVLPDSRLMHRCVLASVPLFLLVCSATFACP